jgi:hypothetical protein
MKPGIIVNHIPVNTEIKKFLPLALLAHFFEIDTIRPEPFSAEKLVEFADSFDFLDEILQLTEDQYNTEIDGTLEDDIYKQNPKRNRSITELVSNAVDAMPESVAVTIDEGEYRVTDKLGMGMTPVKIFRKLSTPKSTSKEGQNAIGRFGLGFYTALAHLDTADDFVMVDTKAEGYSGYRIEFRKMSGIIQVNVSKLDTLVDRGTSIYVKAVSIIQKEYEQALYENIEFLQGVKISVNGVIANVLTAEDFYQVSQTQVYLDPDKEHNAAVLTIGGITINKYFSIKATNTILVVWNLPKISVLSESRDQVRIDSYVMRDEIRKLIECYKLMDRSLQIVYFNSITPLVENLQSFNTSTTVADNLLVFLQKTVAEIFNDVPQVPDIDILESLRTPDVVALHPQLVDVTWLEKRAYEPLQWESEVTKLVAIPMVRVPNVLGFIHDEDNNIVYLDKDDFESLLANDDLWKYDLVFSVPEEEIKGNWYGGENATVQVCEPVVYKVPVRQHHKLFEKHGCLSQLDDSFMQSLSANVLDTLYKAVTLNKTYPVQKIRMCDTNYLFKYDTTDFGGITSYYFNHKKYYLISDKSGLKSHALLDEFFQQLTNLNELLLMAKMIKLYGKDIKSCNVELTAADRLPVYDLDNRVLEIFDGSGNLIQFIKTEIYTIINDNYLVTKNEKNICLYHVSFGLVKSFENAFFNAKYKLLNDDLLLLRFDVHAHNAPNKNLVFNLVNNTVTLETIGMLYYSNNLIVTLINTSDESDEFYNSFSIHDVNGNLLLMYVDAPEMECGIMSLEAQFVSEVLYVTVIRKNMLTELIVSSLIGEHKKIPYERIIGYPAVGYIDENDEEELSFVSINYPQTKIQCATFLVFENKATFLPDKIDNVELWKLCHEKQITSSLKCKIIYLKTATTHHIIDAEGLIIPIPESCAGDYIQAIKKKKDCYVLSTKDNAYLLTSSGELLAQGKTVDLIVSKDHRFYLLDNKDIINLQGDILISGPIDYAHTKFDLNLIIVVYEDPLTKHRYVKLFDHLGKLIEDDFSSYNTDFKDCFGIYRDNKQYLETPFARIHNARVEGDKRNQNIIVSQNRIYNKQGYALISKLSKNPCLVGHDIILGSPVAQKKKHYLFEALPTDTLQSENVLQNIAFLNSFNLNSIVYGNCLRFVELAHENFVIIFPYMETITYHLNDLQGSHFAAFIIKIENHSSINKLMLVGLLNLAYQISGNYSECNYSQKLGKLLEIYGVEALGRLNIALENVKKKLLYSRNRSVIEKEIINAMSEETGQFVYYIFSDGKQLLVNKDEISTAINFDGGEVSILKLMIAHRLDKNICRFLPDKAKFLQEIERISQGCHPEHLQRKLNHAIYHQAHPEKCLYLREFLQNALDAVADQKQKSVNLNVYKNAENECVLSFADTGIGMSDKDAVNFALITGASSKRTAEQGKYIGGRGVGLFTSFHHAKRVQFKTSIGDGNTHYFVLTPVYETLSNGELRVIDVNAKWQTVNEQFTGTIFERISLENNDPVLEAAKYHRAISTHATFINSNECIVTMNGVLINIPLVPLVNFDLPGIGLVKFYKSKNNAITVGGLYLKDLVSKLFIHIPKFIKKVLQKEGLVIDFPKSVQLNRERNDFEASDSFTKKLIPHLSYQCYVLYIRFFVIGESKFDELPYDFFAHFTQRTSDIIARNPQVEKDAAVLNTGSVSIDYTPYLNQQLLTDLLCFLELIPFNLGLFDPPIKYSLMQLTKLFHEGKIDEQAEKRLPVQIQVQIRFLRTIEVIRKDSAKQLDLYTEFKDKEWIPIHFINSPQWELFSCLSQASAQALSDKAIEFGFSLKHLSATAYTYFNSLKIYWNPLVVGNGLHLVKPTYNNGLAIERASFANIVSRITFVVSHELIHINDKPCTGTHNRAFKLRQRDILLKGLLKLDVTALHESYKEFHNESLAGYLPLDAVGFMRMQLYSFDIAVISKVTTGAKAPVTIFFKPLPNCNSSQIKQIENEEVKTHASIRLL